MPLAGTAYYLVGPLVVLAVVTAMVLVSRWVWAPSKGLTARDYGLLVPALQVVDLQRAEQARARLVAAGIKATLGQAPPLVRVSAQGRAARAPALHQVLVFPADLARARELIGA